MDSENKIYFGTRNTKKGMSYVEQEYNSETGEITFHGKIKLNLNSKDGKRMFYYSQIDGTPVICYFFKDRNTYRKSAGEKDEADEKVMVQFGVKME